MLAATAAAISPAVALPEVSRDRAGISSAAGIPDYRSGANTILETGPGKWDE